MRHRLTISLLFIACLSTVAQTRMRDLWATMPADIAPLLTENNRLDMIDFVDNHMEARVRNVFDGFSTLDSLTDDYLRCTLTAHSDLQMRLLPTGDTGRIVAVVLTSRAPEAVSTIRFYNTDWSEARATCAVPPVRQFADSCDEQALRELSDLPLVAMTLSPDAPQMTLDITTAPLSRDARRALEGRIHPITLYWHEETRTFATD